LALQASESLNELNRVEAQLLHQLSSWKQEPNFVALSREKFEGSVSEFQRYRERHCEYFSSLAAGGNSQGDLQLSCVTALNAKRIVEIRESIELLQ
jgi:hypothetical protein